MKVAFLYPTVTGIVEKIAALFPEGMDLVGLRPDGYTSNDCERRLSEWREVGLNITIKEEPYSKIDFSQYDLLIETVETFAYSEDWKKHCQRVECPILVKVCWWESPGLLLPEYINAVKRFPVVVEMPTHFENWKNSEFKDVTLLPEPTGNWWFEKEWTGTKEQAIYVLAGKNIWRPPGNACGEDIFERLCQKFPGKIVHQDGNVNYKTAKQMVEFFSESRVFLNLDSAGARPLAVSFTEAVSAGMPVVARDLPGLSYKDFIDLNGVCTDDFDAICTFTDRCFKDKNYAKQCSIRSRQIGTASFSLEMLRPKYSELISRAQEVFKNGINK